MRKATADAAEMMATAYPRWWEQFERHDDGQRRLELWSEMLDDVDASDLIAAVKRLCMTSRWPPSVAEIRQEARAQQPRERGMFDRLRDDALAGRLEPWAKALAEQHQDSATFYHWYHEARRIHGRNG